MAPIDSDSAITPEVKFDGSKPMTSGRQKNTQNNWMSTGVPRKSST